MCSHVSNLSYSSAIGYASTCTLVISTITLIALSSIYPQAGTISFSVLAVAEGTSLIGIALGYYLSRREVRQPIVELEIPIEERPIFLPSMIDQRNDVRFSEQNNLTILPPEIQRHIFYFLDPVSLNRLRSTCFRYQTFIDQTPELSKYHFEGIALEQVRNVLQRSREGSWVACLEAKHKATHDSTASLNIALNITNARHRDYTLFEILKIHASQNPAEAHKIVSKIESHRLRIDALMEIAKRNPAQELLNETLALACGFKSLEEKIHSLIKILNVYFSKNLFEEALSEIARLPDKHSSKSLFLWEVVEIQACHDLKKACQIASSIKDSSKRSIAFMRIVKLQVSQNSDAVLQLVEKIEEPLWRIEALVAIAKVDRTRVNLAEVLPVVQKSIQNKNHEGREILVKIAQIQATYSREEAIKTLESLQNNTWWHSHALRKIIPVLISWDVEGGLETARSIRERYWRTEALLEVTKKTLSQELLRETVLTAREIQNPFCCAQTLLHIAQTFRSLTLLQEVFVVIEKENLSAGDVKRLFKADFFD